MVAFRGYTHLSIALIIGVTIYKYLNTNIIFVGLLLLGSIFPDIDHAASMIGKYNPLAAVMKHRGFTHTFIGMFMFSIIMLPINLTWSIAFGIGYLSHLLMDALNPTGIMFLYPVKRKHVHFANIRTGGPGESLLFFIAIWYMFAQ